MRIYRQFGLAGGFLSNKIVEFVVKAVETDEGEGAKVRRLFPTSDLEYLDPFVLLDEFYVQPPAGFPNHPHRGFEVVTYMLEGAFKHKDSAGNSALLEAGGVQRITTGKGIVHSELPGSEKMNHGLQLWVNLPKRLKGIEPSYQELKPQGVPVKQDGKAGTRVRVIVGEGSPINLQTDVQYIDVEMPAASFSRRIPEGFNSFIYVLTGKVQVGSSVLSPHEAAVLKPGSELNAVADKPARFVLISGRPHNEPIMLMGSFVD